VIAPSRETESLSRTAVVAGFAQGREGAKDQFLSGNGAAPEVARLGEDDFLKLLDSRCLDGRIDPASPLRHLTRRRDAQRIGAQILVDLGVHAMELLTPSHNNLVGLEGYGLSVVGERPIPGEAE